MMNYFESKRRIRAVQSIVQLIFSSFFALLDIDQGKLPLKLKNDNLKMRCKNCGNETITVLCYFRQNVSAFVARNEVIYSGYYCDKCIKKIFLTATTKTLFGTWWGIVGAMLGPAIIFNNFKEYIKARFALKIEKQKLLK